MSQETRGSQLAWVSSTTYLADSLPTHTHVETKGARRSERPFPCPKQPSAHARELTGHAALRRLL
jgi:hypothetical protein